MRIIGIDPGLQKMGWGIIDVIGNKYKHISNGFITSNPKDSLSERLKQLFNELTQIIDLYDIKEAAVEETFVNANPTSSLKLGSARGISLVVPALAGLEVAEYSATLIKKTVVGTGRADKNQILMMVKTILPDSNPKNADAADALAIAICHANHRGNNIKSLKIKAAI